ncbi:MAG: hypothetical protein ACP5NY_07420 [Thermocladium sp.]
MGASTCPALKRGAGGFICGYTNKQVNPFNWYCLGDYYSCPVYIAQSRAAPQLPQAEKKPETKPEVKPITVVTTTPVVTDPEDAIINSIQSLVEKLGGEVRNMEDRWREYESYTIKTKSYFDQSSPVISQYISLLESTLNRYRDELKEVELRKELGTIDSDAYAKLKEELGRKLDKLDNQLKDFKERYGDLSNRVMNHYRRIIMTSESPESAKIRMSLAKLDELLKNGKISKDVYDKLRGDLEKLVQGGLS